MIIMLLGDFGQTFPVIVRGTRANELKPCVPWKHGKY